LLASQLAQHRNQSLTLALLLLLLLLLAMFVGCCAGVLPFSGGDALIYGSSIKSEAGLDAVRPLMGVCPQFDVLWGELSGLEHLTIAGLIKGLPWNKVCRLPFCM
jgi:hypothetical protein